MTSDKRLRIGTFTRVVIAVGIVAGIPLALRPMLPKHIRYEIDDFFKRPFIPHLVVGVQTLKSVPTKQVVDELQTRGLEVRCYGNLAPSEKVSAMDDEHCWATLSTAFDHIPARDLRLWFQNGRLVHVRFEFPGGELSRIHAYLNRVLDPKAAQHMKPGARLGVDGVGYPIMSWFTPNGSITVNSQEVPGGRNTVLWSSWIANVKPLDASASGSYAPILGTGARAESAYYVSVTEKTRFIEAGKHDGSRSAAPCVAECAFRLSSPDEVARLFPLTVLAEIAPSCMQNDALAFCAVAARSAPERKTHLLISLTGPVPITIPLARIPANPSLPEIDRPAASDPLHAAGIQ